MATALARSVPPTRTPTARAPVRTIVREVSEVAAPRRRARSSGGARSGQGLMGTGITVQRGVVAVALGSLQRTGQLAQVPSIAQLGAEGTVSLVAGFVAGGKAGIAQDIALVFGLQALTRFGREGLGAPSAAGVGATRDEFEVQGDDE